jgi:hypothetical protein
MRGLYIEVTRYRLMEQRCACGHTTRAEATRAVDDAAWPGVPIGQQRLLGPQLAAAVVYLCVRMRLPRSKVSELLLWLLGLEISAALVDQTVHQAARSVARLEQALADDLVKSLLGSSYEHDRMHSAAHPRNYSIGVSRHYIRPSRNLEAPACSCCGNQRMPDVRAHFQYSF